MGSIPLRYTHVQKRGGTGNFPIALMIGRDTYCGVGFLKSKMLAPTKQFKQAKPAIWNAAWCCTGARTGAGGDLGLRSQALNTPSLLYSHSTR